MDIIEISKLQPHPRNPRLVMREDVIASIVAGLDNGFHESYALQVWPNGENYFILSGHHRLEGAKRKGIESVPCFIRDDLDEEGAYMVLATANAQGELSPLEIGMHALHYVDKSKGGRGNRGGLSEYAGKIGRAKSTLSDLVSAARVCVKCSADRTLLLDRSKHLAAIHNLPEACWAVAVAAMLKGGWSAKDTAERVERAKEFDFGREYAKFYEQEEVLSHHFGYADFGPQTWGKLMAQCERVANTIHVSATPKEEMTLLYRFEEWLAKEKPLKISAIQEFERIIESEMKSDAAASDEFKAGDWRENVGDIVDGSIHLLLTDPPYGMDYQSNRRAKRHEKIINDGNGEAAEHLRECVAAMVPKMATNSHALIFTDWRNETATVAAIAAAGLTVKGSLVWVKNNHGSGDLSGAFAPKHERIIHAVKGKPSLVSRQPDVFEAAKTNTDRHPTEKPVDLLAKLIEATTVKGELVADPFAGVASTLVAAKNKGRRFWGCEINDDYHRAGKERL